MLIRGNLSAEVVVHIQWYLPNMEIHVELVDNAIVAKISERGRDKILNFRGN